MKKSVMLLFFLSMLLGQLSAINIKLLKGSHNILSAEDRYYAPFWGLVFSEEGVAENIYDMSVSNTRKDLLDNLPAALRSSFRPQIDAWGKGIKQTETERLVNVLYHRAAGVFTFAAAAGNPTVRFTPQVIGTLLRKVKVYSQLQNAISKINFATEDSKTQCLGVLSQAGQTLKVAGFNACGSYVKFEKDKLKFLREDMFIKSLQQYLNSLGFSSKEYSVFINSLAGALDECHASSDQALYPPYTVHGLLLSLLLKKSETKKDLCDYFTAFMPSVQIPESFERVEYADQEMEDLIFKDVRTNTFSTLSELVQLPEVSDVVTFGDFVCSYVYLKHYASEVPPFAFASNKVFYDNKKFDDADCIETVVRGLSNLVTFDTKTRKMGQDVSAVKMKPQLKAFYDQDKDHQSVGSVADVSVHKKWIDLVENVVGVSYNVLKVRGRDIQHKGGLFIPAGASQEVLKARRDLKQQDWLLGDRNYTVYVKSVQRPGRSYADDFTFIPSDSGLVCYEVKASVSNLILLMQHLFELHLDYNLDNIFEVEKTIDTFVAMLLNFGLRIERDDVYKLRSFVMSQKKESIKICKNKTCFDLNFMEEGAHADLTLLNKGNVPFVSYTHVTPDMYIRFPLESATLIALSSSYQNNSNEIVLSAMPDYLLDNLRGACMQLMMYCNMRTSVKSGGFGDDDLRARFIQRLLRKSNSTTRMNQVLGLSLMRIEGESDWMSIIKVLLNSGLRSSIVDNAFIVSVTVAHELLSTIRSVLSLALFYIQNRGVDVYNVKLLINAFIDFLSKPYQDIVSTSDKNDAVDNFIRKTLDKFHEPGREGLFFKENLLALIELVLSQIMKTDIVFNSLESLISLLQKSGSLVQRLEGVRVSTTNAFWSRWVLVAYQLYSYNSPGLPFHQYCEQQFPFVKFDQQQRETTYVEVLRLLTAERESFSKTHIYCGFEASRFLIKHKRKEPSVVAYLQSIASGEVVKSMPIQSSLKTAMLKEAGDLLQQYRDVFNRLSILALSRHMAPSFSLLGKDGMAIAVAFIIVSGTTWRFKNS